jgi:hypothetical protein
MSFGIVFTAVQYGRFRNQGMATVTPARSRNLCHIQSKAAERIDPSHRWSLLQRSTWIPMVSSAVTGFSRR